MHMHDFMMSMLHMYKLWFRYHYYDIASYIIVMIIIMKLLQKYVVLMFSILILCIKWMNEINSALDYMFSNYKTEQFV